MNWKRSPNVLIVLVLLAMVLCWSEAAVSCPFEGPSDIGGPDVICEFPCPVLDGLGEFGSENPCYTAPVGYGDTTWSIEVPPEFNSQGSPAPTIDEDGCVNLNGFTGCAFYVVATVVEPGKNEGLQFRKFVRIASRGKWWDVIDHVCKPTPLQGEVPFNVPLPAQQYCTDRFPKNGLIEGDRLYAFSGHLRCRVGGSFSNGPAEAGDEIAAEKCTASACSGCQTYEEGTCVVLSIRSWRWVCN